MEIFLRGRSEPSPMIVPPTSLMIAAVCAAALYIGAEYMIRRFFPDMDHKIQKVIRSIPVLIIIAACIYYGTEVRASL